MLDPGRALYVLRNFHLTPYQPSQTETYREKKFIVLEFLPQHVYLFEIIIFETDRIGITELLDSVLRDVVVLIFRIIENPETRFLHLFCFPEAS